METKLFTESGELTPTPPFDFSKTLAFIKGLPLTAGGPSSAELSLANPYCENGRAYLFHVRSTGSVEEPRLEYTLSAEQPFSWQTCSALADRLSFYLSLSDDLRPLYALAEEDPPFGKLAKRLYGFHEVKFPTPFESACWAVIAQRVPYAEARQTRAALMERYGCKLTWNDAQYTAFPEPAPLLHASAADLLPMMGGNERKVEYLKAVAQAFNSMDDAFLRGGEYEEVKEWLLGIKGIGPMAAGFVLVRGLGRMEDLTTSEPNLLETATRVYARRVDAEELNRIAARYGQHIGYWAYYLRAAAEMSGWLDTSRD